MKYWGRGLLLYLTISVILYGTTEIFSMRAYTVAAARPGVAWSRSWLPTADVLGGTRATFGDDDEPTLGGTLGGTPN